MRSKKVSTDRTRSFTELATKFLDKTGETVLRGINPGGVYKAIWSRDASYILRDWFLTGNIQEAMQQIHKIWSHQITSPLNEKVVYGRGSIDMKFLSEVYNDKKEQFTGALPTTIYQAGFSEVYGQNPDIDSTALMISTTAWILANSANKQKPVSNTVTNSSDSSDYISGLLLKAGITDPIKLADYVVPRMFDAVEYLASRDIDNDDLLEQGHNEDWMDTILRAGKIVYSQACWILALRDFALLLNVLGKGKESRRMDKRADSVIKAVDKILWSDEDRCYVDIQEEHHIGGPYRTLTQDVSLYLIAAQGPFFSSGIQKENSKAIISRKEIKSKLSGKIYDKSLKTLDAMKKRLWKDDLPLVTEVELKITGPWNLKPYQYHNQTIWPWCTALEMLARSKFSQLDNCTALLSVMSSGHPHMFSFYEWINPVDKLPSGAFPFRTGISALRLAISDIVHS